MPAESRPRFANFPDPEPKVVIGPNINATATKQLTRLSIGTYEMSVAQQERGATTFSAARSALGGIAKLAGLQVTVDKTRDYIGAATAANADIRYQVWVTTPFEPGQAAHIVWAKYTELSGERKIGVAFKLSTAFTADDIGNILRNAQKNAAAISEGEPYVLKGNPPPRFQKKKAAETNAPTDPVPAVAAPPAAEAPPA